MAHLNKMWIIPRTSLKIIKRSSSDLTISSSLGHNRFYFNKDRMQAWAVSNFGSVEQLQLLDTIKLPVINNQNEVVVKVLATSVNPIDLAMIGGYGRTLLDVVRQLDTFINKTDDLKPSTLIPGRDFAGEIIAKGTNVSSGLKIGDLVYGVIPVHQQGCHAEIAVTSESLVRPIPDHISLVEAASVLYCGLTAWSALNITGDLFWSNRKGQKALIIGGAGGVGTIAIQLLKAWNLEVVATCRTDACKLLEGLGADVVIDYTGPDALKNIEFAGKYDIILDAAGNITHYTYIPFLKDWSNSKYITLRSPLLSNTDKFGLVPGMLKNATDLVRFNLISGAPKRGATLRWGYFLPLPPGIDELHNLIIKRKIKPVVNHIMKFDELPKAYGKMKEGHNRGKIVIVMDKLKPELDQLK